MRVIDWEAVHRHLDYPCVIDSLDRMYRSGCQAMDRMLMSQPTKDGGPGDFLMLPAWIRGQHFGIKIAGVFPGNQAKGLPSIMAAYLLFDGNTGEPLAYIDGTAETLVKTACNSALASRFLSRPQSRTLFMMGAGNLAPYLIEAHSAVRPIAKVVIWNRTAATARDLAAKLNRPERSVTATADPAEAAAEADIITCATFASKPILKGAWLRPGVHVDLVGSYRPDLRESDDDVMARADGVFVDARFSTLEVSGDMIEPIKSGVIRADDVADLFELASGRHPGRTSDQHITVFKSGGGGHEDLATAQILYELAAAGDDEAKA